MHRKVPAWFGPGAVGKGPGYRHLANGLPVCRLRRKGLITRQPRSNTYTLTSDGLRFAIFYTKVHNRVLGPLLAADQPPAPPPLRQALRTIDQHVTDYLNRARLPNAA